jgi:hypothetical protein
MVGGFVLCFSLQLSEGSSWIDTEVGKDSQNFVPMTLLKCTADESPI